MHTSKIPVLILATLGILSCFFPWAESLIFMQSGTVPGVCFAEGGFSIALYVLITIVTLLRTKSRNVVNNYFITIMVSGILLVAMAWYKIYIIDLQTARMLSWGVDVQAFTKYQPANGLYFSLAINGALLAYSLIQLLLRYKKVILPERWLDSQQAGRFYLPAHHNTSL